MDRTRRQTLLEDWLREHRGLLVRIARAHASSASDRADLLQEIALELWTSIPRFRGECQPTTWIDRIALRTAKGWSQRERAHRRESSPLHVVAHVLAPAIAAEDSRIDWVHTRVARLAPVERARFDGSLAHRPARP